MKKHPGNLFNFEKSSLSFSPNISEANADNIKSLLSISIAHGHDVYLGLPTFSMKSKKLQFRYLVERVAKRMKGWGNKYYSAAGKETLIKVVIQSIPTYAMSCFHIPTSICEAIERECGNFWWGIEHDRKKMHWKTWRALCQPKSMGGMGFRHMESFHKALLAKQIWRLISNPESLTAQVLKARYFKHQDIMEASLGSNPYYIWMSLMWSRELLNKGIQWRVCNGEKV